MWPTYFVCIFIFVSAIERICTLISAKVKVILVLCLYEPKIITLLKCQTCILPFATVITDQAVNLLLFKFDHNANQ